MAASKPPYRDSERPVAVISAIVANLVIAAVKFFGASMSGSSAMISEGIHSVVDTANGLLILFGRKQAARPADAEYAFGYGKELYFWTFIVAILVFALGGGASIYEGVVHIRHPRALEDPFWSYIALAVALVSESTSLFIAYRDFRKTNPGSRLWPAIRRSKDPTVFTVLFEDTAAVAGVLIAAAGVFLGHHFQNEYFDGGASVLIGLLLGATAFFLARESKGLLLGEAVAPETLAAIRSMASSHPAVKRVGDILTMYLGADNALLILEAEFHSGLTTSVIGAAVRELEVKIKTQFVRIRRVSFGLIPEESE